MTIMIRNKTLNQNKQYKINKFNIKIIEIYYNLIKSLNRNGILKNWKNKNKNNKTKKLRNK